MAKIAAIKPIIFFDVLVSLNTMNPMIAEQSTTETFVIANTVESFQPVVRYDRSNK